MIPIRPRTDWLIPAAAFFGSGYIIWATGQSAEPIPAPWPKNAAPLPLAALLTCLLIRWLTHRAAGRQPSWHTALTLLLLALGMSAAWRYLPPADQPRAAAIGVLLLCFGVAVLHARQFPWGLGARLLLPAPADRARAQHRLGWALLLLGAGTFALSLRAPDWSPLAWLGLGLPLLVGIVLSSGE